MEASHRLNDETRAPLVPLPFLIFLLFFFVNKKVRKGNGVRGARDSSIDLIIRDHIIHIESFKKIPKNERLY